MNEQTPSPNSSFFLAGGTLRYDAASYVMRPADEGLYQMVQAGKLCYVLTSRQMGKSSLMNRLGRKLQSEGVATALIDLTTIGTAGLEEWYLSLLDDLQIQLSVETDAETWWNSQTALSPVKRFTKFIRDIVLDEVDGQIAIFIDEVDSALNLAFSDDFFAAIRGIYNQTLSTEDAGRLSFVLLGVATPNELIKSQRRTPFNVGERIDLGELDVEDAVDVFSQGLPTQEPPIVYRVYDWTAGHPYLMQRVCQAVARDERPHWSQEEIDELVAQLFFTERALVEESNLQFVNGRILASPQKEDLLALYKKIHRQEQVPNDERDPIQSELKLYGLLKPDQDGHLEIRNKIYGQVFDQEWIKQHQPPPWKRYVWAALILVTILSIALSFYLYQKSQNSNEILAETYISNFNSTENPTLRLDNLAQLIALGGYEDEAVALFEELSISDRFDLFSDLTPDLQPQTESVIETLYLAQWDEPEEDTQLTRLNLVIMLSALQDFERLDNPALESEIENWWQAKEAFSSGSLQEAQFYYNNAIDLNSDNPGTRYERAQVLLVVEDNELLLSDLSALIPYGEEWETRVRSFIFNNPHLYLLIDEQDSGYDNLKQFVPTHVMPEMRTIVALNYTLTKTPTETPTPTITAVPSPTPTVTQEPPTPTSAVTTPEVTPEETAVLIAPPTSLPQAAPTGSIVYTCFVDGFDQICTINADGSNVSQLTFAEATDWAASLTADLTHILFSSSRSGGFTIYEMDADGQNVQPLSVPIQGDYSPIASPDNQLIAFSRAVSGSQNIWLMNRDGSNAHPLTAIVGDAINPSWSPDGQQIAYNQRLDGEDAYSLFIMNADGTEARQLPIPLEGIAERSDWSPDGQWLAFYAGATNDHDIYIAAVDGSVYYQVTDGGDNLSPSFSPDGNWLVFNSARDGDNDLYLIRIDGRFLTPLTLNDITDWQPRWGR